METPGRVAYEAYREAARGRSLVNGDRLPEYDHLPAAIRLAWESAAEAVRHRYGALF